MGNFNATAVIESNTWSEIDSTNAYIEALMTGGKWGDVDPSTITTELNYIFTTMK